MKSYWIMTIFLFIIVIALVYNSTNILWHEPNPAYFSHELSNNRYHFVMITRAAEEDYWQQAHSSAFEVAKAEKVALEYFGPRFLDHKELERMLEMAVLSSVDGILVSVPNEPTFETLINEAISKKIPVVALENDIDQNKQVSFVGVDSYDLGLKTGQALTQALSGNVQFAILVNSNFSSTSQTRYLTGIKDAIKNYPGLRLKLTLISKGSVNAEEQTQTILTNYPEIRAIVCSNASDTLGVAKVVVDLNRVTRMTIIGRGLSNEIANYIKRGVINGVLVDEPMALGAQGLSTLIRIREGKIIQENYKMPLFLVNQKNLNEFNNKFNTSKKNNYEKK